MKFKSAREKEEQNMSEKTLVTQALDERDLLVKRFPIRLRRQVS